MESKSTFVTPQEYMKIQLKKYRLQKRLKLISTCSSNANENDESRSSVFSGCERQKRSNPFVKESEPERKRTCSGDDLSAINHEDDTIFELIHNTRAKVQPNLEEPIHSLLEKHGHDAMALFEKQEEELQKRDSDEQPQLIYIVNLPFDWSIKSRVRILCPTLVVPANPKSNVEVSGQTSFVRCLDVKNTNTGLDISDATRFQQHQMFWQYPHLPWLNLINRNTSNNNQFKMEEKEAEMLRTDWKDSFKNLFQLLRARQCPYFYMLAGHFTVLFRAAGIGGRVEMHALVTPTTKGFRQLLKEDDIEFTQPLKKTLNISDASVESEHATGENDEDEEGDMDEETFLETLGVSKSEIKFREDPKKKNKEIEDDNGELSTILVDGVDCQALMGFLINSKNIVPKVGKLAGIPPTLLSPVAFLGGTLRRQKMRSSKLRIENHDYFSIEISGAILPHTIHSLNTLLKEMKDSYNMSMSSFTNTVAFTKSSRKVMEDLDSSQAFADHVFGRENLSDCGLDNDLLESMCRVDVEAVGILERLQYSRERGGYIFDI